MLKKWKIFYYFDKYYIILAALTACFVIRLNYHARLLHEILDYYHLYKDIILSGFDSAALNSVSPTFPMWGYGWLLSISDNKLFLLLFQNILALASVFLFVGYLENNNILGSNKIRCLKLFLVISAPWHAFHSIRWPYSPAVSFFMLSFVLFHNIFRSKKFRLNKIVVSGVLFGIALNFRSDYLLMPLGFVAIVFWLKGCNRTNFKKCLLWLIFIYIMLAPWMLYTKQVAGHYLLSSTNAGHVFFMGLGRLPDNKWRITPTDGDPATYAFIEEHFGEQVSSLSYEGDRFLKQKFFQLIKKDPLEYLRKCSRSLLEMLTWGIYVGEFYQRPECLPNCKGKLSKSQMREKLIFDPLWFFSEGKAFLSAIFYSIYGGLIIFISFLCLPGGLFKAIKEKNLFLALLTSAIFYQALINILADNQRFYTSNMFFFHLINFILGISSVWRLMKKLTSKS